MTRILPELTEDQLKRLGAVFNFWSAGTPVGLGAAGMKAVDELFCTEPTRPR